MTVTSLAAARAWLSAGGLRSATRHIRAALATWNEASRIDGPAAIYQSHITRLTAFFSGVFARLEARLPQEAGQISFDLQVFKVLRLFERYDQAVQQRRTSIHQPVLTAADEVLHATLLRLRAGWPDAAAKVSAPLPLVQGAWSPAVTPRDLYPTELTLRGHDGVPDAAFRLLPVSLLSLPPAVASAPWLLLLLPHEVGHTLLHEGTFGGTNLRTSFAERVHDLAETTTAGEGATWVRWSEEVFADLISAMTLGGWAAWVLAELAQGGGDDPTSVTHPPLSRRLALLREAALCSGRPFVDAHLRGLTVPPDPVAAAIATLVRQPLRIGGEQLDAIPPLASGSALATDWMATSNPIFPSPTAAPGAALDAAVVVARAAQLALMGQRTDLLERIATEGLDHLVCHRPPNAANLRAMPAPAQATEPDAFLDALLGDPR